MHRRSRSALLFATLSSIACSFACLADSPDPDAPTTRSADAAVGAKYQISVAAELSPEQLHAIAQFVESQGHDVQQVEVVVHPSEANAATVLEVEMWAGELPGDELPAALTQNFAELADAQIVVLALDADAPANVDHGIEPGDDVETIKQKVIADLRAKGVEGDIEVTVTPSGDGHHEIEVEVHAH